MVKKKGFQDIQVGEMIKQLRVIKKLSLKEMADLTGFSTALLSQMENHLVSPSLGSLVTLSKALGVKVGDFFGQGEGEPFTIVRKDERKTVSRFASTDGAKYGFSYESLGFYKKDRHMNPSSSPSNRPRSNRRRHRSMKEKNSSLFSKARAWGMILIIPLLLAGCSGTSPVQAQPVSTAWYLITANPRATSTPTPFQPVLLGNSAEITTPFPTPTEEMLPSPVNPFPSPAASPTSPQPEQLPTPGQIIDLSQIPTAMPLVSGRDTINFILLGSDTRGSTYFRTDTMVIAIVRPSTGEVSMFSLPRDMWVNIPTVGMQRLNTA